MLVLSRKSGEQIVVPECDITITLLETKGNKARLGVKAPAGVAVHRAEVWRRIRGESAAPGPDTTMRSTAEPVELSK